MNVTTARADLAYQLVEDLKELNKTDVATNLIRGSKLLTMKRGELHRSLGYDTWYEFLADNNIARKKAKTATQITEVFCEKHKINTEILMDIGEDKLDDILPTIKKEPNKVNEWIDKAMTWSRKDLINETRRARGKPSMPQEKNLLDPGSPPCCVCGNLPTEKAHWPVTKKMGGKFTIPLCGECHREYHQHGDVSFYDHYKRRIGAYLDGLGGQ